jgi:hypothetical protein
MQWVDTRNVYVIGSDGMGREPTEAEANAIAAVEMGDA